MEGFEDPFNRQTYPWDREDRELLDWYRALGALRREHTALRKGTIRYLRGKGDLLAFFRENEEEKVLCLFNAGDEPLTMDITLTEELVPLLGRANDMKTEKGRSLMVPPRSGAAFQLK